jgi:hypothetical protein
VGEAAVAGDSVVTELVVVDSDAGVAVGLAEGVTLSVFCSQAASRPATTKMQMYFFMTQL